MIHWLRTAVDTYLLHFEHGNGYQFWSGLGGKSLGAGVLWGLLKHHHRWHRRERHARQG